MPTPWARSLKMSIMRGALCCLRPRYMWFLRNIQKQETISLKTVQFLAEIKAIHFFEMSVLFKTGELIAYVYDGGGLYRRKYV